MNLVIMGVQGSGKGTQSKTLSEHLKVPHISVGDLFRGHVGHGTELGKKAREYMDRGELVPDDIVIDMVRARLGEPDARGGFLLDGFPRNGVQLAALEYMRPVDCAILLDLDDETAVSRLAARVECRPCGIIYGANRPPVREGICDECGGAILKRSDDQKEEAVRKRVALYHQEIEILLRYYGWKKVLLTVNAAPPVGEVFQNILKAISRM